MNLKIKAGPHGYVNCPMSAEVSGVEPGVYTLTAGGRQVPCQVSRQGDSLMAAWIEPGMGPGEERLYSLQSAADAPGTVEVEDGGHGRVEVRIGGKLFTRYHYGSEYPRPFLYPFIGPRETQVTRNYPMRDDIPDESRDHPHHRSVWVAYGEVNGTDNWSEAPNHATMAHTDFEELSSGPVFGRIRTANSWRGPDGVEQMRDVREFTFYNLENERLVDVTVRLIAEPGDVSLTDTKEGGIISVRVATTMDGDKGGMIVNAYGGRTEAETWGKPAHWVDYTGPVDGKTMGITIMDHPLSFRYPSRWHVRDYGLFTANPFALKYYESHRGWNGDVMIRKGEELFFKYRLYVHEGDAEQAGVQERYFGFIAPPAVEAD